MAHSPASPHDIRDLLRDHGLRVTRQREELYAALAATKAHPSADELYGMVRDRHQGLSLATVYNTLEVFVEAGLCQRIHASGATRYDATTRNHGHVQTADGRVIDLPEDLSRNIQKAVGPAVIRRIEQELGVRVSSISFSFSE